MKIFWALAVLILLGLSAADDCFAQADGNIAVLKYSWSKFHLSLMEEPAWDAPPDYRQRSDKEKALAQIQYGDIIKSQALKKTEREAARSAIRAGQVFIYRIKLENLGDKPIKNLYWEYQIIEAANPANISSRRVFCATGLKVKQRRTLEVYSLLPPTTSVVTADTLGNNSKHAFNENAVVNRVEFKDGTIWQRAGWSPGSPFAESLATRKLELGEPPCRSY